MALKRSKTFSEPKGAVTPPAGLSRRTRDSMYLACPALTHLWLFKAVRLPHKVAYFNVQRHVACPNFKGETNSTNLELTTYCFTLDHFNP